MLVIAGVIGGLAAVILGLVYWFYFRRRELLLPKSKALKDVATMSTTGEIIPEEGDPVEWGYGLKEFSRPADIRILSVTSGEDFLSPTSATGSEVPQMRRKSDMFVI